ncbi:AAA family ATPase [Microlunatus sp. GCM10028923]|uniref:AAA family ATPase n=1 Tax=Microlunatus sp. GCM10028923 TaxID=3273400 RepID=UPI00360B5F8B
MDMSGGFDEYGTPGGPDAPPGRTTLGALRGAGYRYHSVKTEIRHNLVAKLSMGRPTVPDLIGFETTVLPELERSLFALHDVIVIGDRGQGKSTLVRGLRELLDVWAPVIEGSVLHEHPMNPQSRWARELIAEHGDDTPVDWVNRDSRLAELRATAATTITDLLGDHDPAAGHGLLAAMNRGVIIIDDLGALAPRVQSTLTGVLSDRELAVAADASRLPLDVLVVATMDRIDYQEDGRLIAPLRDRFAGAVTTHYPPTLEDEVEVLRRRAVIGPLDSNLFIPRIPDYLVEIVARFARAVRASTALDPEHAGSVRFGLAALELLGGSAARRASLCQEDAIARPSDLATLLTGASLRLHAPDGDLEQERSLLDELLDDAIAQTCRARLTDADLTIIGARIDAGVSIESGPDTGSRDLLDQLGTVPRFSQLLKQLGVNDGAETPGLAAGAVEFALEGLAARHQLVRHRTGIMINYRAASQAGTP